VKRGGTMFCNYMDDDCPEKSGTILPRKRWNHIFAKKDSDEK